jgi:thiol-disulfide isomerase/thioredoxin
MASPSIDRRALIGAAIAAAAPLPAFAQRANRAITDGPLADNPLARQFRRLPEDVAWPPSDFLSSGGKRPLSYYRGKALIVSLWSETCPPCLVEMPIFAQLNAKYANARFEIVPVVTGSKRLNTMARAQKFLNDRRIALNTLIDGGSQADELLKSVTASPSAPNGALPCNLLIDPEGRLLGRQTGFVLMFPAGMKPDDPNAAKLAKTIWEGPGATAFFETLRTGALG